MAEWLAAARGALRALGANPEETEGSLSEAGPILAGFDRLRGRAARTSPDLFDRLLAEARGQRRPTNVSEALSAGPSVGDAIAAAAACERLNAFIDVFTDAGRTRPHAGGALAGVPFAYKDAFASATRRPTVGIGHGYRWPGPASDSLRRLAAAGAVAIGATNLDPHCYSTIGMNPYFGPVRNPHDPSFTAGGSSGGSAVAVAAGVVPFALGTDTGGSIRIPASLCGVYGLKPTHGLIRDRGVAPLSVSQDTVGILAREPAMIDRVLGVLADAVPAAPAAGNDDRRAVRIGFDRSAFSAGLDADVAAALDGFQARIVASGATIVDVGFPPIGDLNAIAAVITGVEATRLHAAQLATRPELYPGTIRPRILVAACIPEDAHAAALRLRGACLADVLETTFSVADFVIWPTLRVAGHRIHALEDAATAMSVAREYLTPNRPISLLGLPALAVPVGRDGNGIPVGVQIIGPPFSDRAILSLAHGLVGLRFPPTQSCGLYGVSRVGDCVVRQLAVTGTSR